MLIEVVGKDGYKRESTLRVLEQALPNEYMKKNRISIRIVEDEPAMESKAFLYPGLVIRGKLLCEGRIPTPDEVRKWVEKATGKRVE